ncbi:MAG: hypothetical protein KAT77_00700 [Nanoarchaeota archaeon]|nr:hypothetical protein [Nanoarchaeota archaeon]
MTKKISEEEFDPRKHVKEFKRKCNSCGKIWHSLASREKEIQKSMASDSFSQMAFCCNPGAQLQAKRNREASEGELDKLRKCPECKSGNYKEETLIYEKK